MVKNSVLVILISTISIGLVQNEIIREFDGVWYAVAIMHAGPASRPMVERCIKFEFIYVSPCHYLFKRDVIRDSEHLYEEQLLQFHNHGLYRVIQGNPPEGSMINIVDHDNKGEMVLFIETKQLYMLLSRSLSLSESLLSKYRQLAESSWVLIFVDQMTC